MGEVPAWDVEGPVRAEIFLVWLNGDRPEITRVHNMRPSRDEVLAMVVRQDAPAAEGRAG
jgi:hypothetical protein